MNDKKREVEADDYPDEVFASEEAFFKRFRIVEGNELVKLKQRIAKARGEKKSRVTIYLDGDIISKFKETAEKEKIGYQTLINDALRRMVDAGNKKAEKQDLKEEILKDKKFLRRLKAAMSA